MLTLSLRVTSSLETRMVISFYTYLSVGNVAAFLSLMSIVYMHKCCAGFALRDHKSLDFAKTMPDVKT
jgi:hypothetical protein